MKRSLLPLVALTVLFGACTTTQTSDQRAAPIRTGTRATAWGQLPTYDQSGHYFQQVGRPPVNAFDATVAFDVMVNADGSVHDVALLQGSGNDHVDRQTLARFKKARYTMKLSPTDPAPYVVSQTVVYKTASTYASRGIDPAQQKDLSGPKPPTQSYSTSP